MNKKPEVFFADFKVEYEQKRIAEEAMLQNP